MTTARSRPPGRSQLPSKRVGPTSGLSAPDLLSRARNDSGTRAEGRPSKSLQLVLLALLAGASYSPVLAGPTRGNPLFEQDVHPVLAAHCVACHQGESAAAQLDLQTAEGLLKGSANGPVVLSGAPERSYLFEKITRREMPPPGMGAPLNEEQIQLIRLWIEAGLPTEESERQRKEAMRAETRVVTDEDRQFWAFQKPVQAEPPKVESRNRVRTPIDAFILAKLEEKELSLSPDAPKLKLMRRAYFDLTGLPPSPEEVSRFVSDKRPGAYERLIDRLLESPHYGERWGRHWLDVAGFVQEYGYGGDIDYRAKLKGMWRYRDYVIRAFNQDKPYDRFIAEQLAGDELVDWRNATEYTPEILDALAATGYLRSQRDVTHEGETNNPRHRHDILSRLVDHVSSGVLGLTVGCARCHNHKFDPIPTKEYYRLAALFSTSYNPDDWLTPFDRYLPDVPKPVQEEIERHNAEIDRPLSELKKQFEDLRGPYEQQVFESKMTAAGVPDAWREDVIGAFEADERRRSPIQRYFFQNLETALKITPEEVDRLLSEKDKVAAAKLQQRIETLESWRRSYGEIPALWDVGEAPTYHLFHRGNTDTPGPEVTPGFLTVLSAPGKAEFARPPDAREGSSGRRLALARWLVARDNPITARVMVNRIWMHHFGRGIVETAENFGELGMRPTHPKLLDWLAVDFMDNGWKIKRLHKLIMTSSVYRQMSRRADEAEAARGEEVDGSNYLLWRMNLRRLEAEAVRDSILAVSGKLDQTMGGPHTALTWGSDGLVLAAEKDPAPNSEFRRSVYLFARRNYSLTLLDVFDYPVVPINTPRRSLSATPLQSLTLLNGQFAMERAGDFADRVSDLAGTEAATEKKAEAAFEIALARKPTAEEMNVSTEHFGRQVERYTALGTSREQASHAALTSLCQMLMATNEFLYVE